MEDAARGAYQRGLILVTGAAVAWSSAGYFTRLIPLDAWTMLVWRGVFAALGMLVAVLAFEGARGLRRFRALGAPGALLAVVSGLGMVLFITSLRHTTVAHVGVIYATVPVVGAGMAWLALGEVPTRGAVIASLGALVGVVVMVGLGRDGGIWGDLMAFGMTLCMAGIMVITRRHPGIPSMQATVISALLSGAIAVPFSGAEAVAPQVMGLLPLLALFGVINLALGSVLFMLGAKVLPVIETALIGSLDAPLAPVWVWLAFGETPGGMTLLGGGIVFAAVVAHVIWANQRAAGAVV